MSSFTGYAIEQEDRDYLKSTSSDVKRYSGSLPDRVDPRQTDLYKKGWIKVENQNQQGSCQGNALSECGEYCYGVQSGRIIQLSRQYAYIRSQQFDNIKGDRGSTLSGGTKCALEGICSEETGPYMGDRYPGWTYITDVMKNDAKNYILRSHTDLTDVDAIKAYIGSGMGIPQIGAVWNNSFEPDSNGCIRRFSGSNGGGHSWVYCGYVPDEDVGVKSSAGYWFILKNSWGTRWSPKLGGFAYMDPSATRDMLRHNFTVVIGRSDMTAPEPRPIHVDFTKKGNSING